MLNETKKALVENMGSSSVKKSYNLILRETGKEIVSFHSKKTCLFIRFCENIQVFEKTESLWRLSIHIQPVVTTRFLPVPCNIVSPEHAFIIAKGQEYKAPASFSGQEKAANFFFAH